MFGKKTKPGDVCELRTGKGLAYFQCMRYVPQWGTMIRVLPGFFQERPSTFAALTLQPERFITFFPVDFALKKKVVENVGPAPLPPAAQAFPMFRAAGLRDRDGKVMKWFLWNGGEEAKPIGSLSDEMRSLPLRQVLNDTALIERIESGWLPEHEA
jgi:hypothetical protein